MQREKNYTFSKQPNSALLEKTMPLDSSRRPRQTSITRALQPKPMTDIKKSVSAMKRINFPEPNTKSNILPPIFKPDYLNKSLMRENSKMEEVLNQLIRHKYKAEKILGQGAFSTIYLGSLLKTPQQKFAIKYIRNNKRSGIREFDILKSLGHSSIIQAEELFVDETNNGVVLVLEMGGERTLSDVQNIAQNQVFSESDAIYYFTQIVRALQHMHERRIVHADLKTENVAYNKEKNLVKLIDFGFARRVEEQLSDEICGTLSYLSPQQCRKEPFCPFKSDVWSLGIILYKLLFN